MRRSLLSPQWNTRAQRYSVEQRFAEWDHCYSSSLVWWHSLSLRKRATRRRSDCAPWGWKGTCFIDAWLCHHFGEIRCHGVWLKIRQKFHTILPYISYTEVMFHSQVSLGFSVEHPINSVGRPLRGLIVHSCDLHIPLKNHVAPSQLSPLWDVIAHFKKNSKNPSLSGKRCDVTTMLAAHTPENNSFVMEFPKSNLDSCRLDPSPTMQSSPEWHDNFRFGNPQLNLHWPVLLGGGGGRSNI